MLCQLTMPFKDPIPRFSVASVQFYKKSTDENCVSSQTLHCTLQHHPNPNSFTQYNDLVNLPTLPGVVDCRYAFDPSSTFLFCACDERLQHSIFVIAGKIAVCTRLTLTPALQQERKDLALFPKNSTS